LICIKRRNLHKTHSNLQFYPLFAIYICVFTFVGLDFCGLHLLFVVLVTIVFDKNPCIYFCCSWYNGSIGCDACKHVLYSYPTHYNYPANLQNLHHKKENGICTRLLNLQNKKSAWRFLVTMCSIYQSGIMKQFKILESLYPEHAVFKCK
jgi:hypothetical protein